nr:hypothetical protein [Amanita sp. CQC-2022a]
MTQITNYKQQIITNIITKYKNIIIYLNINYILFILIDFLIDSQLSNYYFTKFSQILYIQKLFNIFTLINYASLVNYILNLEYILNQNINILLTSYDIYFNIPNLTNIIIFLVINLTFYINFLVFLYIFIKINNNSLFNSKLIRIFITQINLIKIIYVIFIFIFNLFSLYYQLPLIKDYYLNLEANIIIAKQIFINFINFDLTNFNLDFKNINLIFLNRVDTFQKLMNSELDSNSKVNVSDINVSNSIESVSKVNINNSVVNSDYDNVVLVTEEIKFNNFKDLSIEDKRSYIINQYENKGMKPTFYTINWLSDKVLSNTDGKQNNVDIFINNYLNQILNLERDTQLKSFSFHREKPFLRHLVYKTPLEYPHVIPTNKNISEFEESELKDALIKNDD